MGGRWFNEDGPGPGKVKFAVQNRQKICEAAYLFHVYSLISSSLTALGVSTPRSVKSSVMNFAGV